LIQLERATKIFPRPTGDVTALSEVTFEVARGEFVAVCGPSGCGKSTLLTLVGGLGQPTSGRVIVDSQDLAALSASARARFRARQVGFVFQMFHLLPYLTVLENVAAAALDRDTATPRELLERFHLGDRLTHRPAELSAGQRQRVAMARALVNRPALLLADEPTGNLDPQSAADVLDLLSEFHRAGGTVLLVTHEEQAARRASRVLRLEAGALVGDGRQALAGTA